MFCAELDLCAAAGSVIVTVAATNSLNASPPPSPPPILLYMHKRLTYAHLCSQLLDSTVLRWPAVASAAPAVNSPPLLLQ